MITELEYALMAGASYYDTRDEINRIPDPAGWTRISRFPEASNNGSGFEASAFGNGTTLATSTEIVISFAGTYAKDLTGDWAANFGLATGVGSAQLLQAAEYYLQVKAANPNDATITFTGHSLGGGLAALVGVFFGVQAVTFDQAPFAQTARFQAINLSNYLAGKLDTNGNRLYSDAALAPLTSYIELQQAQLNPSSIIPNTHLITNINVQGEFLSGLPWNILNRIGATVLDIANRADGVAGDDLHAQALLTAFLQSDQTAATGKALNDVTFKLPDLLKMIFNDKLFAHDTDPNTTDENFLERLVKHEAGVQGAFAADAMVTRFTSDLWKLAQPGGLTMSDNNPTNAAVNDLSKALIAFAMQKYYEEQLAAGATPAELFTDLTAASTGSNGIQFDMGDVSQTFKTAFDTNQKLTMKDAKGFDLYFKHYLGTTNNFIPAEQQLIQSLLPYLRDWYVQAGTAGMIATDMLNRGVFMLGGSGSDALVGGNATDLLVGNAGGDLLQGGKGNDVLLGGTGNDTYVYTAGDGFDIILDRDGQGSIAYDGATLAGGAQYGDNRVHRDADKHLYVNVGQGRLVIDGNILIEDQQAGELGLTMSGTVAESVSVYTIEGDLEVIDSDPAAAGLQWSRGSFGNLITDPAKPQGGRSDLLTGSPENDALIGKGGSDILDGRAGDDRLYADTQVTIVDAIANGNSQSGSGQRGDWLNAGAGDDTLIGSNGNDLLAGGIGSDILIGGAGDDSLLADNDSMAGNGFDDETATYNPSWWFVNNSDGTGTFLNIYNIPSPDFGWDLARAQTDILYAGAGNDFAWGGRGNDVIFGEGDADILSGNSGNDIVLGGDGADFLHGDVTENVDIPVTEGNDYLDGGAQDDVIYGNGGDDILIGGRENDYLYGGAGNDIYLYNTNDGVDYIYDDFRVGEKNVIRFGAGINQNNIRLGLGSLLLNLGKGDAVHIAGFDQNDVFNSSSISSFEFADGSTLTTSELLARGFDIGGSVSSDILIGTNVTDRINGLGGG